VLCCHASPLPLVRLIPPPALALLAFAIHLAGASPMARSQATSEKPVAVVENEPFYEKDLFPAIESQIYKVRLQEYELKLQALEAAINKKLVREKAQEWNMTDQEWIQQEVDSMVPDPTDEEVEQQFAMQMFRSSGQVTMTKDEIKERLKQNRVQAAREQYYRMLRELADVKIYLPRPKLDVDFDPARVRGAPGAAVTIVEFSDFQCPYCLQAYTTVKNILAKYEGKVKLAYRDLPLLGVGSNLPGSAEASRCAGEQGKFWEYHDLLFENQDDVGLDAFNDYAERLSLDTEQFTSCLGSGKFKASIQEDFDEGIRLGITGTPAFFINGIFLNGARPQSEFEQIIDTELENLAYWGGPAPQR
jgi:predicted DsbA family dithiol-disulfide isomerase